MQTQVVRKHAQPLVIDSQKKITKIMTKIFDF